METITHPHISEKNAPLADVDLRFSNCPREGFDIGWAYANFGMTPPRDSEPEIHNGHHAGMAHFGQRTPRTDRFVRKYLHLRTNAWRRGRLFASNVTPEFLECITREYCPVTRLMLTTATKTGSDWSIDRLINDAGYAPGNLVVMATRANLAKDSMSYGELLQMTKFKDPQYGLAPIEWARMAAIAGMVADRESVLPLLVVPPPCLVVANRYTMLQVATMMMLVKIQDTKAMHELRNACRGKKAKKAFDAYMQTAGRMLFAKCRTSRSRREIEWAIGDAWQDGTLLRLFKKWMEELPAEGPQACLAAVKRFDKCIKSVSAEIIDAWGLDTKGFAES